MNTLTTLIERTKTLVLPGAYDAFSARMVQGAGFEAVYIGSYATAAAAYGLPDVGALTLDELVAHARKVVQAVDVPVIADAEGGFFDPANIWRTVRSFEEAGVAAIHIEDHAGGKHTNLPQTLIPLEMMLARLRAALDARKSPDFIIMARTDAIWALKQPQEAIRRIRAFVEIGIEYVFANGASPEQLKAIRKQVPECKLVTINLDQIGDRTLWQGAADVVIDYGYCLQVVAKSLDGALQDYRRTSDARVSDAHKETADRFEQRLDYEAFTVRALNYQS